MSDTKASEAARELLRHRWGNRTVLAAAALVVERADELDEDTRAELVGALTGQPPTGVAS